MEEVLVQIHTSELYTHFCEIFPGFLIVYTPPFSPPCFRICTSTIQRNTEPSSLLLRFSQPPAPLILLPAPGRTPFPPLRSAPLHPFPLHPNKISPQITNQATTPTPQLLAVATTLLHKPSSPTPFNLSSVCLIRAISKTCFKLTSPTTSPFPGVIPPRIFPLRSFTPAACRSKYDVVGVRRAKWKLRSGRMVIRVGIGVPAV